MATLVLPLVKVTWFSAVPGEHMIAAGAAILVAAGLGAIVSIAALPMTGVLFALGLGWNLCYVGGSTLLSDRLSQVERARVHKNMVILKLHFLLLKLQLNLILNQPQTKLLVLVDKVIFLKMIFMYYHLCLVKQILI